MPDQPQNSKRQRIVDSFASCLARKSYDAISIKEIAEGAGVPVGSVYYYFKSKEDIFIEHLSQPHFELMEMITEWGESEPKCDGSFDSLADELIVLGRNYLNKATEYQTNNGMLPTTWAACVSNDTIRAIMVKEYDDCHQTIARALERKGLSPEVDSLAAARLLASLFDGVKVYSTLYPEKLDFAPFFDTLKALASCGGTAR